MHILHIKSNDYAAMTQSNEIKGWLLHV